MRSIHWFGVARAGSSVLLLASSVHAGIVQNVNAPGPQYTSIQQAVDAAADGDVLLVTPGAYLPFRIDGKSLTIAAVPGNAVAIAGTVEVLNLQANGSVVLLGLKITGALGALPAGAGAPALVLTNNQGHVRIADATLTGGPAYSSLCSGYGFDGAAAVIIEGCPRVVLVRCAAQGGYGSCGGCLAVGGNGGDGARTHRSTVSIHGGTFRGGEGGRGASYGGHGGAGYRALDQKLFAAGATFVGGDGGDVHDDDCEMQSGSGGDGMFVGVGPARLLGNTMTGGAPGSVGLYALYGLPGQPISGSGLIIQHPGNARTLRAARVASDNSTVSLTITGIPGEQILFCDSFVANFAIVPYLVGTWLVKAPAFFGRRDFLGVQSSSGSTVLPFLSADLVSSSAAWTTIECLSLGAPGTAALSDPELQVLIQRAAPPDCNGNGVNDFLDVLEGTSPDINSNLVPDECDYFGPLWYVDANAPVGGNGSANLPFQTIDHGMQMAANNHTVLVVNGTYVGPGNCSLSFGGKLITVRSVNGPAACIIDCQGQSQAFLFTHAETEAARLEGFTIKNGLSTSKGGALFISGSRPTIENCVFTGCSAQQSGGAIYAFISTPRIAHCVFTSNHAGPAGSYDSGGGAIAIESSGALLAFNTFENNSADRSGGGMLIRPATTRPVLTHCVFRGNTASLGGGVLVIGSASNGSASFSNSSFSNNSASRGGAVAVENSAGLIAACTLANNNATNAGALSVRSSVSIGWSLSDSILWNNGALQIELLETSAFLSTSYCDVQGGQSGVMIGAGVLLWGSGNLDVNPVFVDADFRLGGASRCIDAGANSSVPPDLLDLDGDGNVTEPEPIDLSGVARFVDLPAPNTGNGTPPLVDIGCQERQTP